MIYWRNFICFFIVLIILFLDIDKCLAEEKYVDATVNNADNIVVLELFSNDSKELYGFLAKINYDKEDLNLIDCKSDNYNVSFDNDMLLLDGVKGYSNEKMAICEFEITNKKENFNFDIVNISLSDGFDVIYNENISLSHKMNYLSEINGNTYLSINNEVVRNANEIRKNDISDIFMISIVVWFMIVASCLVCMKYKLIFIIIFVSFISFPISVLGKSNLLYVTDEQIDDIKSILLKNKDDS